MKNWLVALILGSTSFSVIAGDNSTGGFYAGGGLATIDVEEEGRNVDVDWNAVEVWWLQAESVCGWRGASGVCFR